MENSVKRFLVTGGKSCSRWPTVAVEAGGRQLSPHHVTTPRHLQYLLLLRYDNIPLVAAIELHLRTLHSYFPQAGTRHHLASMYLVIIGATLGEVTGPGKIAAIFSKITQTQLNKSCEALQTTVGVVPEAGWPPLT